MCSAFYDPLFHLGFYAALFRIRLSYRPRARGGIANIGDVLRTSLPSETCVNQSGLAVVNAPFREYVVFSLPVPPFPLVVVACVWSDADRG